MYITSLSPKATNFNNICTFPGVISDELSIILQSKPSNLVLKKTGQGFGESITTCKDSIFTYPLDYRLVNNFYYNPYVETLGSENKLLFDITKIRNINHHDILWSLNPYNQRYGSNIHEITELPITDFLVYEAILDAELFRLYVDALSTNRSIDNISALHEAIEKLPLFL